MSMRTMPILFLNMGGEMAYILEQRLQAQSVRTDKSTKVMGDILSTMFNKASPALIFNRFASLTPRSIM